MSVYLMLYVGISDSRYICVTELIVSNNAHSASNNIVILH